MGESNYRVLWVEDHQIFDFHLQFLREAGVEIDNIASFEALKQLPLNYDLYIIDYRLGVERGTDCIEYVLSRHSNARLVLLSSFVSIDNLGQKAGDSTQRYGLQIGVIGKEQIAVTAVDIKKNFVQKIVKILGSEQMPSEFLIRGDAVFREGEVISNSDYQSLLLDDKIRIAEAFYERNRPLIDALFSEGAVWLLFFGNSTSPNKVARREDEILDKIDVGRLAAEKNFPPFQFRAPQRIKDNACGSLECEHARSNGITGYPQMEFDMSGETVSVHFDTGLFQSLFDAEYFLEKGLIDFSNGPELMPTTLGILKGEYIDIDAIFSIGSGGTRTFRGRISFFATLQWASSKLAIYCSEDCSEWVRGRKLCKYRQGLVGRKVLFENSFSVDIGYQQSRVGINRR